MNYYLLIPFFLIVIFFLPIKVEAKASFNALDLSGVIGLFLYKKKIMHDQFRIVNGKIVAKDYDKDSEEREIDLNSKEVIFIQTMVGQIKDKTRLKEISMFYNIGAKDAFYSSMVAGYVNLFATILFTMIKNQKPTASLSLNDTVSYNREICQLAVRLIMSISLFDVAYSFINSIIISKKKWKQKQLTNQI